MNRIHPEVWDRLGNERPHGETLRARSVDSSASERVFAALDSEGRRHLLVTLRDIEEDVIDRNSRGVIAVTRELTVHDNVPARYLDVTCLDPSGHEVFDLIGGEIAERLANGAETAPEVVTRVLAKWRRFWGQSPRQILSREEQLGLFAELWFLGIWLLPRLGGAEAVKRWRGPSGARHDFEWPRNAVEVKATTSTRGRIHRIHGLDQLEAPENGDLLLFSLRLREEASATNTLQAVVGICRSALDLDPSALGHFEETLAKTGYSPAHLDEYAKLRLRVVEQCLFRVESDFPRITKSSFAVGVPSAIERVEYEINISGYGHLLVATTETAPIDL